MRLPLSELTLATVPPAPQMFSKLHDDVDDTVTSISHVPWEVELLGDKRHKMVEVCCHIPLP